MIIVGHGYAGVQKFNSNEHSKTSECKNSNKKVNKMIDAVNVIHIIVYQYWDNKISVSGIIKNEWEPGYET